MPTILFTPLLDPDVRAIADQLRPKDVEFRNVSAGDKIKLDPREKRYIQRA